MLAKENKPWSFLRLHRKGVLIMLIVVVLITLIHTSTTTRYTRDEHYMEYHAPTTHSDKEQGVFSKPLDDGTRVKATFVTVCRNQDLYKVIDAVKSVQEHFNDKYHYDWVFLSESAINTEFREVTSSIITGHVEYGYVKRDQWSFPKYVDAELSYQSRIKMAQQGFEHALDVDYRHWQRYIAGLLTNHTLLDGYDYFCNINVDTRLSCDINYDIFKFMKQNNKKYGFSMAKRGNDKLNPSLYETVARYFKERPDQSLDDNMKRFVDLDPQLDVKSPGHCEFFTGLEIGELRFFRSQRFWDLWEYLDKSGGFYYELWEAGPVRTVMSSMLLRAKEIHWFSDIGFQNEQYSVCPIEKEVRRANKCTCDPKTSASWNPRKFCMHKFFLINGYERPPNWRDNMNRGL